MDGEVLRRLIREGRRRRAGARPVRPHRDGDGDARGLGLGRRHLPRWRGAGGPRAHAPRNAAAPAGPRPRGGEREPVARARRLAPEQRQGGTMRLDGKPHPDDATGPIHGRRIAGGRSSRPDGRGTDVGRTTGWYWWRPAPGQDIAAPEVWRGKPTRSGLATKRRRRPRPRNSSTASPGASREDQERDYLESYHPTDERVRRVGLAVWSAEGKRVRDSANRTGTRSLPSTENGRS